MSALHPHSPSAIPPMIKGLPFLGVTVDAFRDVTGLLVKAYHQYGPVFRMNRLGKEAVVLAGIKANNFYVEHEESHFYTQEVYKHLCAEGGTDYNFIALEGSWMGHLNATLIYLLEKNEGLTRLTSHLAPITKPVIS